MDVVDAIMSGAVCATGVAFGASGAVLRVSVVIGIVTTGGHRRGYGYDRDSGCRDVTIRRDDGSVTHIRRCD